MHPRDLTAAGADENDSHFGQVDRARRAGDKVKPRNLLLIVDVPIRRQSLEYMLTSVLDDFSVGSVGTVDAPYLVRPDIVLVDVGTGLQRPNGFCRLIEDVQKRFTETPVLALSDESDIDSAIMAMGSGLRGFLPPSASIETLVAAIRLVLAGGIYVPSEIIQRWVGGKILAEAGAERAEPRLAEPSSMLSSAGVRGLTEREIEVVEMLQRGKPNKIIAHELKISESTVKVHMRNIMRKMSATNRTQVVFLSRENQRRVLPTPVAIPYTTSQGSDARPSSIDLLFKESRDGVSRSNGRIIVSNN